jgi:spore germination protein YaaH
MKKLLLPALLYLLLFSCSQAGIIHTSVDTDSQTVRKIPEGFQSTNQILWEENKNYPHTWLSDAEIQALNSISFSVTASDKMGKEVFGFYPNWMGTDYQYLNWNLLTTVAYFGIETDATGAISNNGGWPNSATAANFTAKAHQTNTRVLITWLAFSTAIHDGVLRNTTNRSRLINNIVSSITSGNADGVNIDFEMMSASNRDYFTAFIRELNRAVKSVKADAIITLAMPAVDWTQAFDIAGLSPYTDIFFVMGYDYHWSSGSPGPCAPLLGESSNLTKTTDYYLSKRLAPAKVVIGVPYYGRDWATSSATKGAAKTANGTTKLYKNTMTQSYTWDDATQTPWYAYQSTDGWHQLWFDNRRSIEEKIKMINERKADGCGMWALAYDGSQSDLWSVIQNHLGVTAPAYPEGSHNNPYKIHTFPYSRSGNTLNRENLFYQYSSHTQIENGPEEVYQITIPQPGTLSIQISDGSGVDVDPHLLSILRNDSCVARNDTSITYHADPGTLYLVCDTYGSSSNAGAYAITADFTPDRAGTLNYPVEISASALPAVFTENNSTALAASSAISTYAGFTQNESGPEVIYRFQLSEKATLTAALSGMASGTDIDIHLVQADATGSLVLSGSQAQNVISRNNTSVSLTVSPGIWYLVADTFTGSNGSVYKGAYTIQVNLDPIPGTINSPIVLGPVNYPAAIAVAGDTSTGISDVIQNYSGFSQSETGPEIIYQFTLTENSIVSLTLTDMPATTDMDIHLVQPDAEGKLAFNSGTALNTLARHDKTLTATLAPGRYFTVVDTYNSSYTGEKPGAFTLTLKADTLPGTLTNPLTVSADTLPAVYTDTRNTADSPSDRINTYNGFSQDESGNEWIYQIILREKAVITAGLSGMTSPTDIDIHLMQADTGGKLALDGSTALNVAARNNTSVSLTVEPGIWYLTADTYKTYAGTYTLSVKIEKPAQTIWQNLVLTSSPIDHARLSAEVPRIAWLIDGLSGNNADDYLSVVCPPDHIQSYMIDMSGCALTAAFVWRCLGIPDSEIWKEYVIGSALTNIINIAKRHSAWITSQSKTTYFQIGDVLYVSSPEHMMVVSSGITVINSTTIEFDAINGGGLTADGKQLISNLRMEAIWNGAAWTISKKGNTTRRTLYGVARTVNIPRTLIAHLP